MIILDSGDYDKIAIERMRKHNGGLKLHTALGNKSSIRIRWKLKRLGLLKSDLGKDLSKLIDEIAINETFQDTPINLRYSAIEREEEKVKIFSPLVDEFVKN